MSDKPIVAKEFEQYFNNFYTTDSGYEIIYNDYDCDNDDFIPDLYNEFDDKTHNRYTLNYHINIKIIDYTVLDKINNLDIRYLNKTIEKFLVSGINLANYKYDFNGFHMGKSVYYNKNNHTISIKVYDRSISQDINYSDSDKNIIGVISNNMHNLNKDIQNEFLDILNEL